MGGVWENKKDMVHVFMKRVAKEAYRSFVQPSAMELMTCVKFVMVEEPKEGLNFIWCRGRPYPVEGV